MRNRNWKRSQQDKKRNLKLRKTGNRRKAARNYRIEKARQERWQRTKAYVESERRKVIRSIHLPFTYTDPPQVVDCSGALGLEEDRDFEKTLQIAESFIDFNSQELTFDLRNSTRIWPTALTMLCSLQQWTNIAHRYTKISEPKLRSTTPQSSGVESYLAQSGFYQFVGVKPKNQNKTSKIGQVIPIERPKNREDFREKEDRIIRLLSDSSSLTPKQIEWFNSVILTESYVNVTEHGVITDDLGWWLICQVHPTHKFISLCIADNGIGIRNSLALGPQGRDLPCRNIPENEGLLIEYACRHNVSGASDATQKEGKIRKKHPRGSKRGNGLSKVIYRCGQLGIKLNILSHYGYVSFDASGTMVRSGARPNRIFAGTLLHFVIPGK